MVGPLARGGGRPVGEAARTATGASAGGQPVRPRSSRAGLTRGSRGRGGAPRPPRPRLVEAGRRRATSSRRIGRRSRERPPRPPDELARAPTRSAGPRRGAPRPRPGSSAPGPPVGAASGNAARVDSGPAAASTPSIRWSPDIQSAGSTTLFAWVRLYRAPARAAGPGASSANLPLNTSSRRQTRADRPPAGPGIHERGQRARRLRRGAVRNRPGRRCRAARARRG